MPGSGDPIEPLVGGLMVHLLGAKGWELHDKPGASELTHDLDVQLTDLAVVGVEVTRLTDQARRQQRGSEARYVPNTKKLRRRWDLTADRYDVNLRTLHRDVIPSLVAMEGVAADRFPRSSDYLRPGYLAALKELRRLGLGVGESSPVALGEDGAIHVRELVVSTPSPDDFAASIQHALDANWRKLDSMQRDRSLLAVWTDTWTWSGPAPMSHGGQIPDRSLSVPGRCAGVVVLREAFPFQAHADRAWSFGSPASSLLHEGWTDISDRLTLAAAP